MLSPEMQRVVLEQRLGFVATVTAEGRPNLSPKGTTTLWDEEHLMFADLASPGTIENLATNPHVEINVVDPILLASTSPQRRAILEQLGLPFEVVAPGYEEVDPPGADVSACGMAGFLCRFLA